MRPDGRLAVTLVCVLLAIGLVRGEIISDLASGEADRRELAHALVPDREFLADQLRLPTRVAVAGDRLVVLDRYAERAIVVVDRATGGVLTTFGRHGRGPAELFGPFDLSVTGSLIDVVDFGANRLTRLDLKVDVGDPQVVMLLTFDERERIVSAASRTLSGFLALSLARNGTPIVALDSGGGVAWRGKADLAEGVSPIETGLGVIRRSPDGSRFVRTRRYGSSLELLNAEGLTTGWAYPPYELKGREQRFGYLDAATGVAGFLALYSGRTRSEYPGRANFGSEIHRFSWEGELIETLTVGSDLVAIAWSEDQAMLYGLRHDPRPAIVRYKAGQSGVTPPTRRGADEEM